MSGLSKWRCKSNTRHSRHQYRQLSSNNYRHSDTYHNKISKEETVVNNCNAHIKSLEKNLTEGNRYGDNKLKRKQKMTDEMSCISNEARDAYVPKRSRRVGTTNISDGDIWIEIQVIQRIKASKRKKRKAVMKTRSLFYSINTRKARWDEPPTGASVVYLTEDLQNARPCTHPNIFKNGSSIQQKRSFSV